MYWRISLYRGYLFYIKTLRNFIEIIQYERIGKPFHEYRFWNGSIVRFSHIQSARFIFKEIWMEKTYTKRYPKNQKPKIVVDIGANIGLFSMLAIHRWQDCHVYAYEPAPDNFSLLSQNIKLSRLNSITP